MATWKDPKIDWDINPKSPMAADFNRIEENIKYLKEHIDAKKGLIVDAINTKSNIVTIENSYQELANAITNIHKNPRMASGTGQLIQISDSSAKLVVAGLSFTPARIFITGKVRTTAGFYYDSFNNTYKEYKTPYEYAVISDLLIPTQIEDKYFDNFNFSIVRFTVKLQCVITRHEDGFEAVFTNPLIPPTGYTTVIDNYETNYWFAYEQEG